MWEIGLAGAVAEVVSPAFGESFEVDGSVEQVLRVRDVWACGSVIEMIDIGDRDGGGIAMDDFDFVSGGELAFFDDGEVEAAGVAFDEALDHVVAIKADRDFVAGHARLRNLQKSRADAELVADVERVFEQALGGEVFAESPPWKVRLGELLAPVRVVFGRVGVDGFVGAAVHGEIGLAVATQVELLEFDGALDGRLEDSGGDLSSLPQDDTRAANVDGDEFHPR